MYITYLIIGFTCLISIMAFNDPRIKAQMMHWPYEEKRKSEYFRWLTSGFLHNDSSHLLFNMLTLYFFGINVEIYFAQYFPQFGKVLYLIFYLVGILVPSYATYLRYKDVSSYAALGASGAVSAVLFAAILFDPLNKIYIFFIPIGIPGFIFGVLYLWYSDYMAKKGGDNIDHFAHFIGAAFGFLFPILLNPDTFVLFLRQIQSYI